MVRVEPDNQNGLEKTSAVDAFRIRSVSQEHFIRQLGSVSKRALADILKAVKVVVGI